MSLTSLVQFSLLSLFVVAIFLSGFSSGPDSTLLILSVLFYLFTLLAISTLGDGNSRPLIIYFIIISIIWCGLRVVYLLYSFESLNFDYLFGSRVNDVAWSVLLMTISSIFFISGIIFSGHLKINFSSKLNLPIVNSDIKESFLIKYFAFVLLYSIFDYQLVWSSGATKSSSIISMLFSFDMSIFLVTGFLIYNYASLSTRNKFVLLTLVLGFILVRTLGGSKAGIFQVFIASLATILAINHNTIISKKVLLLLSVFLIPPAFLLFIFGDEFRVLRYQLANSGDFNLSILFSQFSASYENILSQIDMKSIMDLISRRLGYFDYMNVMFNKEPVNNYLGVTYGLKSFWNVIWPNLSSTLVFHDAGIFQANLFKVAYGHGTYQQAVDNYHSDMLPLFGVLYINFKSFSLLILFFLGYVSSLMFRWIDVSNLKVKYIYKSFFIFFYGDILFGMGLVSSFQQILFYTLMPLILYFLLQNIRLTRAL